MNFDNLNSATKYPSIPTYHTINPKNGRLTEPAVQFTGHTVVTEKIDGANGRIIVTPDGDWFIGSREEILYARGDRIINPERNIVPALLTYAGQSGKRARAYSSQENIIWVLYLEVYGSQTGVSAKQYTTAGRIGARLFDIAGVPAEILAWPREKIASWRQHGGQSFLSEHVLRQASADERMLLTPRLGTTSVIPSTVEGMNEFLKQYTQTRAPLDETGFGSSEGVVLRSEDRSVIAKARFQDYRRTLERRNSEPAGKHRA